MSAISDHPSSINQPQEPFNPWEEFNAFAKKTVLEDSTKKPAYHIPAGTCFELELEKVTKTFHTFRFYPNDQRDSELFGYIYEPSQPQPQSENATTTFSPKHIVDKFDFKNPDFKDGYTFTKLNAKKVTFLGSEHQRSSVIGTLATHLISPMVLIVLDYIPFLKPEAGRMLQDLERCMRSSTKEDPTNLVELTRTASHTGSEILKSKICAVWSPSTDFIEASLHYGDWPDISYFLEVALRKEEPWVHVIKSLCKYGKPNARVVEKAIHKGLQGELPAQAIKALATSGGFSADSLYEGLRECERKLANIMKIEKALFKHTTKEDKEKSLEIAAERSSSRVANRLLEMAKNSDSTIDTAKALQNVLGQADPNPVFVESLLQHNSIGEVDLTQVLGNCLLDHSSYFSFMRNRDSLFHSSFKTALSYFPLSIINRGWLLRCATESRSSDLTIVKTILEDGPISKERKSETLRRAWAKQDWDLVDLLEAEKNS